MTSGAALDQLAERMGIVGSYRAFDGTRRVTPPATKRALLAAMGCAADTDRVTAETLADIEREDSARLVAREILGVVGATVSVATTRPVTWQLTLEGDASPGRDGRADTRIDLADLPIGMHRLEVTAGAETQSALAVIAPARAPSVAEITGAAKLWGVTTSLYGLRSERNLGVGDYDDLGAAAAGLAAHGADFVGINPVHAVGAGPSAPISPYSPSHRGFLNTRHIAPDRIPGWAQSVIKRPRHADMEPAATAARAAQLVDYTASDRLRAGLLESVFATFEQAPDLADRRSDFDTFVTAGGEALHRFALYEALSEIHGPRWSNWPATLRDAETATCSDNRSLSPRIRFHAWLQWIADAQLGAAQARAKAAGMQLGLYLDIAVGARPQGAEVWSNRAVFADGVAQGAPPDPFSRDGQNWALAPFSPAALASAEYRPFVAMLHTTMRHAGLVRIDHILGFSRAFWLPATGEPGAYVRYPTQTMLALTAIEAHRAGCVVVGEDLGLVAPDLRQQLGDVGLYGCAVAQLERQRNGRLRHPDAFRAQSLASFGNHDTATLRGYVAGRDLDWLERLGHVPKEDVRGARAARDADVADLATHSRTGGADADGSLTAHAVHAALAESPAAMVAVQLDDVFAEVEQQNLPGTIDEHPNWRRPVACQVGEFATEARLAATGAIMDNAGRTARQAEEAADEREEN